MSEDSPNIPAYADQACTTPINHYLVAGDWFNYTGNGSLSTTINVTYPITVPVQGDTTDTVFRDKWFKGPGADGFAANADAGTGHFQYSWTQSQWYNHLPSTITYIDEHPGGDGQLAYVSNNVKFTVTKPDLNVGRVNGWITVNNSDDTVATVMKSSGVSAVITNDSSDLTDADYSWTRASHPWTTDGLVQGKNTVYFAGTDAAANYMLGSAQFCYDTVCPKITFSPPQQTTAAGSIKVTMTVSDPGSSSGTGSGIASWKYTYSYDGGQTWSTWAAGSGLSKTVTLSSGSFNGAGGTMEIKVQATDKAGNTTTSIGGPYVLSGNPGVQVVGNWGTYRTNTDVISSFTVTNTGGSDITPDAPGSLTFTIPGVTSQTKSYVLPAGGSELVWFRWHTPSVSQTVHYTVGVSAGTLSGSASGSYDVEALVEYTPPDPTATDTQDPYFNYISVPTLDSFNSSASWIEYYAFQVPQTGYTWIPELDSNGDPIINKDGSEAGYWQPYTYYIWQFATNTYSASVSATLSLKPDSHDPSYTYSSGLYTMKSGYGINNTLTTNVSTNNAGAVTGFQSAVEFFPEFEYNSGLPNGYYDRVLEMLNGGFSASFDLKPNLFSQYASHVHFTPCWWKDGQLYTPATEAFDVWTPCGMLGVQNSASIMIQGNLFSDYHVGPEDPSKNNANGNNVYSGN